MPFIVCVTGAHAVDTIFAALSECQALHPDEDDEGEAEGDAELYVGDGANGDAGESEDDGMFDDADNDDTDLALNEDDVGVDAGMFGGMVELTPEGMVRCPRCFLYILHCYCCYNSGGKENSQIFFVYLVFSSMTTEHVHLFIFLFIHTLMCQPWSCVLVGDDGKVECYACGQRRSNDRWHF